MKIELLDDGRYAAVIAYEQRLRFRADGWSWDATLKRWTTKDRTKVVPWMPFCVGRAREALDRQLEFEKQRMAPSMAKDADIDIPVPQACLIRNHKPYAYHPFQKAGVKFIDEHDDTLLADPPGLGKTIQAIGASNLDPTIQRVLIICPAFLKIHWKRTWEEWDVKHLTVGVAHTKTYQRNKVMYREHVWPDTEVVIVNREMMDKFEEQIKALEWDLLVIDEYHIGFPRATTRASKSLYGGTYTKPKRKAKEAEGTDTGEGEVQAFASQEAPIHDGNTVNRQTGTAVDSVPSV